MRAIRVPVGHGAREVVGIDVESPLVGASRMPYECIEPEPLPFEDATFDVVFAKDAMAHVPDKPALYAKLLHVLRPGRRLVTTDWLAEPGLTLITGWTFVDPAGRSSIA